MNTSRTPHLCAALGAAAFAFALPAAWAAGSADKATIERNYQAARSTCQTMAPADRTNCLRDAGAARAQALRTGQSSSSPEQLQRNALQRCQVHKTAEDQATCERMARGDGNTSGSVESGGMIRELTTQVPAPMPPRQ